MDDRDQVVQRALSLGMTVFRNIREVSASHSDRAHSIAEATLLATLEIAHVRDIVKSLASTLEPRDVLDLLIDNAREKIHDLNASNKIAVAEATAALDVLSHAHRRTLVALSK